MQAFDDVLQSAERVWETVRKVDGIVFFRKIVGELHLVELLVPLATFVSLVEPTGLVAEKLTVLVPILGV